ncbi:MAG: hypothetical protein ACOZQL_29830 [Myxococcota bacterium]
MSAPYDDCPDHGLPGTRVCDSCVRPLCRKCRVVGSRCAECLAAQRRDEGDASAHVPQRATPGNGKLLVLMLFLVGVTLLVNWKGCPGLPRDIVWLK